MKKYNLILGGIPLVNMASRERGIPVELRENIPSTILFLQYLIFFL